MTEIHDGTPIPPDRIPVLGGSCGCGVASLDAGAGPSWLPGAFPNEKAAVVSGGRE